MQVSSMLCMLWELWQLQLCVFCVLWAVSWAPQLHGCACISVRCLLGGARPLTLTGLHEVALYSCVALPLRWGLFAVA